MSESEKIGGRQQAGTGDFPASAYRGLPARLGETNRGLTGAQIAAMIRWRFNKTSGTVNEAIGDVSGFDPGFYYAAAGVQGLTANAGLLEVINVGDYAGANGYTDFPNPDVSEGGLDRSKWVYIFSVPETGHAWQKTGNSEWMATSAHSVVSSAISDSPYPVLDERNRRALTEPQPNPPPDVAARNVAPSQRSVFDWIAPVFAGLFPLAPEWEDIVGGNSGIAAFNDTADWQDLRVPEKPATTARPDSVVDSVRITMSGDGIASPGPFVAAADNIKAAGDVGLELYRHAPPHARDGIRLLIRWQAVGNAGGGKYQARVTDYEGRGRDFGSGIKFERVSYFYAVPANASEFQKLERRVDALEYANGGAGIVVSVVRFVRVPKDADVSNLTLSGGDFGDNYRGKNMHTEPTAMGVDDARVFSAFPPAVAPASDNDAYFDPDKHDIYQFRFVYDSLLKPAPGVAWIFEGKRDPATAEETLELVTLDVVGGNSGLARLDDEAMPVALPLPYDLGAGDLAGVLNGGLGQIPILMRPLDVTTLPTEKPAAGTSASMGKGYWSLAGENYAARFRVWKDGDAVKLDGLHDNDDATAYFTSLTIQITAAKAAELGLTEPEADYDTIADELLADDDDTLLPAQTVAFAGAAGNGQGSDAVVSTHEVAARDLTAEEIADIPAAGEGGAKTSISFAVEWDPGAYSGFEPANGKIQVQVGQAADDTDANNPVAADWDTIGTLANMLAGESYQFSHSITAAAVAKGANVRLVFSSETKGGAYPQNAFIISDVIIHQKGNAVERVFALARAALSGTVAAFNAALDALRGRVGQNEHDIAALSARPPITLSDAAWAFLRRLGLVQEAGDEEWTPPLDGGAWVDLETRTLTAAGVEKEGAVLAQENAGPGTLETLFTPLNEIHKILSVRGLQGDANGNLVAGTKVFVKVRGLYGEFWVRFIDVVLQPEANGGNIYQFIHPDGGIAPQTLSGLVGEDPIVRPMVGDGFEISLTPGPTDLTEAEFVVKLYRANGDTYALNSFTAPPNSLARLRFNNLGVWPHTRTGHSWAGFGVVHHTGIYVRHSTLGRFTAEFATAAGTAANLARTFFGQLRVGAARQYDTIRGKLEFLNDDDGEGGIVVPEGKLRVRKTDGTEEDFSGGTFASPAFRYVRVAHGAAAPTLTGGTPGKDWRGGAFETEPVAGNGGTLLGSWPAAPDWNAYDYYEFRADVDTASDAAIVWANHGKRDGAENPPSTTSGLNRAEVLGVISHADAAAEEAKRGTISFAGIRNVIAAGVAVADSALELAVIAVFTRWLPAASAGKFLRWTADGKLENVDSAGLPAFAAGGADANKLLAANAAGNAAVWQGVGSALTTIELLPGDETLQDEAMPQSIPLPEGVVAGDLRGVLNGVHNAGGSVITMAPLDVATLPAEKPAAGNFSGIGYWADSSNVPRWRIWRDGDAIKVDRLNDNQDDIPYFTSLTIQITLSKRLELAAASGGGNFIAAYAVRGDPRIGAPGGNPVGTIYRGGVEIVGAQDYLIFPATDDEVFVGKFRRASVAAGQGQFSIHYSDGNIDFTQRRLRGLFTLSRTGQQFGFYVGSDGVLTDASGVTAGREKGMLVYVEAGANGAGNLRIAREDTGQFLQSDGTWGTPGTAGATFNYAALPAGTLGNKQHEIDINYLKGRLTVKIDGTIHATARLSVADQPDISAGGYGCFMQLATGNTGSAIGAANEFQLDDIFVEQITSAEIVPEVGAASGGGGLPALAADGSDKGKVVAASDAGDAYVLRAENAGGGYTITDLFTNAGVTGQQNLSASIKGHKWVNIECISGGLLFSGRHRGAAADARVGVAGVNGLLRVAGNVYVTFATENTVELRNATNTTGHSALLTYVGVEN